MGRIEKSSPIVDADEVDADVVAAINAKVEAAANKLRIAGIPVLIIAFTSAWAAGPILRFAAPWTVWLLGTCIALLVAVACVSMMFRNEGHTPHVAYYCIAATLLAGLCLLAVGAAAALDSARLDGQCELLEIDAMSLKPLRIDSLDLFEKLGCRPQGVGTLEFRTRLPANPASAKAN
jgi:hypothetical protein